MPIVPDDKDWTWVLKLPCPECGFDASSVPPQDVGAMVRANAREWSHVLQAPLARLQGRSSDERWSPLEYACHVRDVFALFGDRLDLMLTMDNPTFPNWDQDRAAVDDRYNEQDPGEVDSALRRAAEGLAVAFERVEGEGWDRLGSRSDGAHFTVASFGRYMIHDPIHHLNDIRGDLA